jgi:peptide deformylase
MPIRMLGDPVLREPTKSIEDFDDTLRRLAADMTETMYAAPGVGLAANQVGLSSRASSTTTATDTRGSSPTHRSPSSRARTPWTRDACRSRPLPPNDPSDEGAAERQRSRREADRHTRRGSARPIFQHETDHLSGGLYIDRLDDEGRREVMRQLRELELGL